MCSFFGQKRVKFDLKTYNLDSKIYRKIYFSPNITSSSATDDIMLLVDSHKIGKSLNLTLDTSILIFSAMKSIIVCQEGT
jgi:hypothetical protein